MRVADVTELLFKSLRNAFDQTDTLVRKKILEGKAMTVNDRVGMYCTNLRRELHDHADKNKQVFKYFSTLCKPDEWEDAGKMIGYSRWTHSLRGVVPCDDGEWSIDRSGLAFLVSKARMQAEWKPSYLRVNDTVLDSMMEMGEDIRQLRLQIDKATVINGEAENVMGSLCQIAAGLGEVE